MKIRLHIPLRRLLSLMLVGCLLMGTAVSCGGRKKSRYVLRTYSIFGEENDRAAYSDILSSFTKEHSHIVVNDTTTTRDNSYKMELSIPSTYRGPNVPDVIYYSAISDMSALGDYFMTVDDIRADYPDFADRVSEAVLDSAAASDGRRFCIPLRGDWQGIVVNAALFRRSALAIPTTWEDVMRAALHFQKGEVTLFANSLEDSSALLEYLVRGVGGVTSVQSAIDGDPDDSWSDALDALEALDALDAFPPMKPQAFDTLVSSSDLLHTTDEEQPSAVERYNSGNAAILLIDNSFCGQINADIDSQYLALPRLGTGNFNPASTTTTSIQHHNGSGPVFPSFTANTLPPSQPSVPASGSGELPASGGADSTRATQPQVPSPSDAEDKTVSEAGLYVSFSEGFYITKKAYYDADRREDVLALIETFLTEENCLKLCGASCQVPALSSVSRAGEDGLTDKSNIYHAVIRSVQSADAFLLSTQTPDNRFFWNHCAMAVSYYSKGVLTKRQTLALIADTQQTAASIREM